jgi:hypothetical protein
LAGSYAAVGKVRGVASALSPMTLRKSPIGSRSPNNNRSR